MVLKLGKYEVFLQDHNDWTIFRDSKKGIGSYIYIQVQLSRSKNPRYVALTPAGANTRSPVSLRLDDLETPLSPT